MAVRTGIDAHKNAVYDFLVNASLELYICVNIVANLAGINNLICIAKAVFFQPVQKDVGQSRLDPRDAITST